MSKSYWENRYYDPQTTDPQDLIKRLSKVSHIRTAHEATMASMGASDWTRYVKPVVIPMARMYPDDPATVSVDHATVPEPATVAPPPCDFPKFPNFKIVERDRFGIWVLVKSIDDQRRWVTWSDIHRLGVDVAHYDADPTFVPDSR